MINQVSNIICPDKKFRRQMSKGQEQNDALLDGKRVENSSNSLLDHAQWWVSISR